MNNRNILFILPLLLTFFMFSCKKETQSCTDGIFDPEKEEQLDCGGVCPPCDFEPTDVETYLYAKINGKSLSFSNFSLVKENNWHLRFENDSLRVFLNLGSGDTLGGRPIESNQSSAQFLFNNYSSLQSGTVVFSEIDDLASKLSGFFEAKFIGDNNIDTLFITNGEFSKLPW